MGEGPAERAGEAKSGRADWRPRPGQAPQPVQVTRPVRQQVHGSAHQQLLNPGFAHGWRGRVKNQVTKFAGAGIGAQLGAELADQPFGSRASLWNWVCSEHPRDLAARREVSVL